MFVQGVTTEKQQRVETKPGRPACAIIAAANMWHNDKPEQGNIAVSL